MDNSTEQALVTIIIPFYNDSKTIERAIRSAIHQEYQHTEIIIVDDGSNSEEANLLRKICDGYPKTKVITRAQNRGVGYARNTGIQNADGEYICFLDADDEMYPHKLLHQLQAMEKYDAEAVLSDYDEGRDGEISSSVEGYSWYGPSGTKLDTAFAIRCGIQLVGMLFHRKVLQRIDGFRTMYNGQDKDLFIRSAIQGTKWIYQKGSVGVRHTRPDSISANEYNVLKRNCYRNVMLLAAHELEKQNALGEKEARIIAEKVGIEARRWAHYKQWDMAKMRWNQATTIYSRPRLHGTTVYKTMCRVLGFEATEKIRSLLQSFRQTR